MFVSFRPKPYGPQILLKNNSFLRPAICNYVRHDKSRYYTDIRHRASGTKWSAPRLTAVLLCCCCSQDCSFLRGRTPGVPGAPGSSRALSGGPGVCRVGLRDGDPASKGPLTGQDGPKRLLRRPMLCNCSLACERSFSPILTAMHVIIIARTLQV